MFYLITAVLLISIGFVGGIAFERNNSAKIDSAIKGASDLKAKGKALLDALKGK